VNTAKRTLEGVLSVSDFKLAYPKPEKKIGNRIKGETLRLQCACHDAWCFVLFAFDGWELGEGQDDLPFLEISFKYCPGNIWRRLKKAWQVIRRNEWHEQADLDLLDIEDIRKLRDFCDRCLAQMPEKKP
jgi:hypothetical protein